MTPEEKATFKANFTTDIEVQRINWAAAKERLLIGVY